MIDCERFEIAIERARVCASDSGIGSLGEKHLHRSLKYYFEPDESFHELEFLNSVADIKNGQGIIEIQTRSFNKLVSKLERFLPNESVTVVYPIIEEKTICKIDTVTGESLPCKKSPKKGKASDALTEISQIRRFIPNENLTIKLVFVNAVETRMLNGKKQVGRKKTSKIDCIPTAINSIVDLCEPQDFAFLLPLGLPEKFTAAEFEKLSRIRGIALHNSLMLLLQLGIVSREKGDGRAYIYSIKVVC